MILKFHFLPSFKLSQYFFYVLFKKFSSCLRLMSLCRMRRATRLNQCNSVHLYLFVFRCFLDLHLDHAPWHWTSGMWFSTSPLLHILESNKRPNHYKKHSHILNNMVYCTSSPYICTCIYLREFYWTRSCGMLSLLVFSSLVFLLLHLAPPDSGNGVWVWARLGDTLTE